MSHKFRRALAMLAAMLFLTTACGTNVTNNSDIVLPVLQTPMGLSAIASETCANDLYPIKQGAAWRYTATGGSIGSFTYVNSVTETSADGFVLATEFSDFTNTQEWSCEPDGLKALQPGGGTAVGISVQHMTAGLTALEVTGINLPRIIKEGTQWEYGMSLEGIVVMPDDPQAPARGTYSVITREIGKEIITVPAGTFETFKLQSNSTVEITTTFAGLPTPIKFNATTITWYAPGVGYVKSVENGDFGNEAFSTTTELQSYSVP